MLKIGAATRVRALLVPFIAANKSVARRVSSATSVTMGATKLHGRAFYESIGSPKFIVAPMVDQSEFAWRMLTRSFMSESERSKLLAYTPMLHARLYANEEKYRRAHFQPIAVEKDDDGSDSSEGRPWLDGNPSLDRPLFVQFCANDEGALLAAARQVAAHCDAVDLNLGCPQGIARRGHYGAFLQEDQDLIFRLINTLHRELPVPVTAKIRILETKEQTLAYARNVLRAGASILTVHGRRREQKGHMTGLADWEMLRYLREQLPPDTVLFANGNVLQGGDVDRCLEATGADGVMSAEGNLSDPALFASPPPVGAEGREYWRSGGSDERGGWRVDAVMRRYLDILHRYVMGVDPPARRPLFMLGDDTVWMEEAKSNGGGGGGDEDERPHKRRRKDHGSGSNGSNRNGNNSSNGNGNGNGAPSDAAAKAAAIANSPNMAAVQAHLFHLLRHLVTRHTDVRDMLARSGARGRNGGGGGGMATLERILAAVEVKVAEGLMEYEGTGGASFAAELAALDDAGDGDGGENGVGDDDGESSKAALRRCRRPWWVAQPIIRPLPREALAKGALTLSKKEKKKKMAEAAAQTTDPLATQPAQATRETGETGENTACGG